MITGKTRYYAILGDPIEQALSPVVHNAAFEALGMDAVMLGCRVTPEELKKAVEGTRALHFEGLAVTMPHKTAIIPLLDEWEEKIDFLGAVNVVTCKNGVYKGYNTDGDGFVQNMKQNGTDPAGKRVFLFGAGGAARGLGYALLESGVSSLTVCNIDEPMAMAMIGPLRKRFPQAELDFVLLGDESIPLRCLQSEILINATSMGMNDSPSPHVDMVPWTRLPRSTVCAEIIHKPLETAFVRAARAAGLTTLTGDGMLLYQGIETFRLMNGCDAPQSAMRAALQARLESEKR